MRGRLLLHLAEAESRAGRLDDALAHGLEAARALEEAGDPHGVASALRVTGGAYRLADRLDEAADCLRRGLELAERVGSVEEIGGCLINLGIVELKRSRLTESIACYRRAVDEFERAGHASGRAIASANLAWGLLEVGDLDEAIGEAARSRRLASGHGLADLEADVVHTAATIEARRGAHAAAATCAEEAAELFERLGALERVRECVELAAGEWAAAGEATRARAAHARAHASSMHVG
jgi:tetratricopeptide (TPR) repeat protein